MNERLSFNKYIFIKGITFVLFINSLNLKAQSNNELFEQGNSAYNEGNYEKAVTLYEQILNLDQHSAALYFNLGNCYYRLNQVAESIYYFEKAKQLSPSDKDININSTFAKNMTIDAIELLPESQLEQLQKGIFNIFSFSIWVKLTIILIWFSITLFLGYIFSKSAQHKRIFFFCSLIILFFFIGSLLISFSIDQREKNLDYAILFSKKIDTWSEPNQKGDLLFTLHEGTKVQLIDELAEWKKIRIANGSEGWLKNAYLKRLNNKNQ